MHWPLSDATLRYLCCLRYIFFLCIHHGRYVCGVLRRWLTLLLAFLSCLFVSYLIASLSPPWNRPGFLSVNEVRAHNSGSNFDVGFLKPLALIGLFIMNMGM